MNRYKILTSSFLLFIFLVIGYSQKHQPPEGGKPKDFRLPQKQEFSLDNGLKVTMVPYGVVPKVTIQIKIRTGNLNEPPEETWIADLTLDLLKEGTTTRDAAAIAEAAANMGGSISTSVSPEVSTISGEALSEFGSDLIALLADIIRNPAFPEKEFERLKKDYLRHLSIAKTQPQSLAQEKFLQVLYGDHPFGRVFPTEEMLFSYTIQKVKNFYKENFGARRTHIYIAGIFDGKAMKKAIEEAFQDWNSGPEPLINIPKPTSQRKIYLIDRPGAPQSTLYIGLPVADPSLPEYMALQVTNTLLGGYFSSRITANIREDKGYTYSPRSSITSYYRNAFWLQVADVTTTVTGASLKEIFYEINRLQNEAPSLEELRGVQNYMAGNFVLRNSSPTGIISQLAFMDFHGLGESFLTNYVKNIYAVTPENVQMVAQQFLKEENMIIVVVGDKKQILEQLKPFGEVVL